MKLSRIILSAVAVIVCMVTVTASGENNKAVYPDEQWQKRKPAQLGLDENMLKALGDYAGGSGCVIKGGYMVYTWGDAGKRRDVASAAKPVYTHFLLTAVEKDRLASIDEPVCKVEDRLVSVNKSLGYKDRKITWRHLCNQVSCYGVCERPGEAYDYNDYNMALFFDCLFLKIYHSSWAKVDNDILRPGLTEALQCEDKPTFMAFGLKDRPGRLGISPRDFARFGLLYLRKGKWKDRQIISAEHVKTAVSSRLPLSIPRTSGKAAEMISGQRSIGGGRNQCDHDGSYSFAWWINGIGRDDKLCWPDVPADAYGCFGHNSLRAMVVIPSLDMIVSWNDTKIKGVKMANDALKLLVKAAGNN